MTDLNDVSNEMRKKALRLISTYGVAGAQVSDLLDWADRIDAFNLADIWDDAFTAGSEWVPETKGIPHDPPLNPYHEYPFLGAAAKRAWSND